MPRMKMAQTSHSAPFGRESLAAVAGQPSGSGSWRATLTELLICGRRAALFGARWKHVGVEATGLLQGFHRHVIVHGEDDLDRSVNERLDFFLPALPRGRRPRVRVCRGSTGG